MGFVVTVGIIVFVVFLIKANSTNSREAKAEAVLADNPFKQKLQREQITLDDGRSIEVLSILVRGIFNSGNHGFASGEAYLGATLFSSQADDPKDAPVLCAIKELQHDDYPFFNYTSDPLKATYGLLGGWDNWVRLIAVPIDSLTFARSGRLKIKLNLRIAFQESGDIFERSATIEYDNRAKGYLDAVEEREQGAELAIRLAVLVAGVDGVRDQAEGRIVQGYIKKNIAELKRESDKQERKRKLNKAVTEAHKFRSVADIKRRGLSLAAEAASLAPDIKFQIMELLLDVARADDVAAKHETEFLNSLAHRMGMDLDEYKNMRDKALPIAIYESNTSGADGSQIENMLGLKPEMSVADKKAILSKEYRKWNALKNSSDPVKSKQARDMVKAISEIRKSL